MNKMVKKFGLIIALMGLMLALSGCVTKSTSVNFTLDKPLEGKTIYVQYSDGTTENSNDSDTTVSDNGLSVTVATYEAKWIVGAYVSEGEFNWVPNYELSSGVSFTNMDDVGVKPTIQADYAVMKGLPVESSIDGYVSVQYAVYGGSEPTLVDGQTVVFAHADKDTIFYDTDPKSGIMPKMVTEGISSFTKDGLVTFLIQSDSTDISDKRIELYSGVTNKIYDSYANKLNGLELSSGELSQAFDTNKSSYTASVPHNVGSLSVTSSVYDTDSVLKINGNVVGSGQPSGSIPLSVGENTITVEVTPTHGPSQTYTIVVTRAASSNGNNSDGNTSTTPPVKVVSTNGQITVPRGAPGEVSLDDELFITIPADASLQDLKLSIAKVTNTQELLTPSQVLASPIFEVLKNYSENFSKPVKLSFIFNQASVKSNQTVAVFYYDETKKGWVKVENGQIAGNKIEVEVDHFTKYAVFAVDVAVETTPETPVKVSLSDISGHWAEASIIKAVNAGIVNGYPDLTFKPGHTVTRAEFSVMLMNALKPQVEGTELAFTDSAKIEVWAKKAVAQAVQAGILKGYEDGSFRPDANMTRSEMAVMIANAMKSTVEKNATTHFADDLEIQLWAKGSVAVLSKQGILNGTLENEFNPKSLTTRAEAVIVLLSMLEHQ